MSNLKERTEDPLAEPMRKLTEDSLQFCLGLELFPIICKLLHEPCSSLFAFTVIIVINSQHFCHLLKKLKLMVNKSCDREHDLCG